MLLVFLSATMAQAQQSLQQLDSYMAGIRTGNYTAVPMAVLQDSINAPKLLEALSPYVSDTLESLRSEAYSLCRRIAQDHAHQEVRMAAVEAMLPGLQDVASAVVGNVAAGLRYFKPADFSPAARESLKNSLNEGVPHKGAIAALLGYLEIQEARTQLYALLQQSNISRTDKWAFYLALARMGDPEALQFTMSRIRRMPLNDDLVYDILPDLVYVRQPEAIAYLVELLFRDEKSCSAANVDLEGRILCAYRIMEMLAPVVLNFPLESDPSGDLDIDDYEEGLLLVREWFSQFPDYGIIKDKF